MGSSDTESTTSNGDDCKPSLPKLLSALALGARSVNALPLAAHETNNDDIGGGEDDAEEDELSFLLSLPEFATLHTEAQQTLSTLLCQALEVIPLDDGEEEKTKTMEFDDPHLWEQCANACDALYDRVTDYIATEQRKQQQGAGGGEGTDTNNNYESLSSAISNVSERIRDKSTSSYGRMINSLASMEKPQNIFQGFVTQPPQNSRDEPFTPIITYDGAKQAKLDGGEYTSEGNGLDTRSGGGGGMNNDDVTRRKYSPDMIAPSYHYEHPYREEIEGLEYRPWQLDLSNVQSKDAKQIAQDNNSCKNDGNDEGEDGIWIDTEDDLIKLCTLISDGQKNGDIHEIALDLEAHSHRTFSGFVCLIQLSIRRRSTNASDINSNEAAKPDIDTGYDFLIDALSLRHAIPAHLGPILCNPNILKVMHGADSDIPWLQRDFGCYIVNLFDTGRASRALKFQSAGLAYLLRKYANVDADKVHQLSDWRRRPLPEDMRSYAVSDTRYLLDIYDQLRLELDHHPMKDVSILSVLDRSKQVCLIRYDKEPFRPSGYVTIMDGGNKRRNKNKSSKVTSELSPQQEAALKVLYDWRDKTARQEDESVQYVCPNAALLRITSNRPVTVSALQRLINPLPPLVMRRSQEILDAIKTSAVVSTTSSLAAAAVAATANSEKSEGEPSKSTVPPPDVRRREMLSPVLGSEALYQQAGWLTPTEHPAVGNGSSEEEDAELSKFLDVNDANQGYASKHHTSHSIEMSPPNLENDSVVNENEKRSIHTDGRGSSSLKEDVRVAQRSANLIQKEMAKAAEIGKEGKFGKGFSLIDLIRPMPMSEDVDLEKDQSDEAKEDCITPLEGDPGLDEEDEMMIPRSMHEIYHLSNANRRRTGKEKPTLQFPGGDTRSGDGVEEMKEDDIAGANAVINSRGPGGYFGGSKRQRTTPGKDGDIKLMTKLGWIKDKRDAESLAVVSGDTQSSEKEGTRHGQPGGQYNKKSSAKFGQSMLERNYYSSSGTAGIGALPINAAPSSNVSVLSCSNFALQYYTCLPHLRHFYVSVPLKKPALLQRCSDKRSRSYAS